MENSKVLVIGGSRNIGYFSAVRLLDLGATVTFLLRSPNVFDDNQTIQKYVQQGKARLLKGDALIKEDVQRAWDEAAKGGDSRPVDFLLFTVGGTPGFKLTKGFVISPPNLVTQSLLNTMETLPTPHPKIITISSIGLTRDSHATLPLLLKPLYACLTVPHKDKCGAEEVVAHCAGWSWDERNSPGTEILGEGWADRVPAKGQMENIVVVRPALLTDGECRADKEAKKPAYRVESGDIDGSWTVSRKDVSHFLVEGVVKHWDEWRGKCVSIAY
ncbi:hypothetical protein SERLA73DRAFT_187183 [Serpula lacrymans var. lacrymans S7.3]|uniref:NAD(P)-binding domain-containing protein n=2 Tax=Serpula lacrymans var. lacrymans TaxID=341189 RepID=F8Q8M2_SERL3|nr:uncharacterized protein SERLADRAFT_476600 [Serpula lacrymans var. lacrymans S7.9]EGN95910.1 hypothetical protein SERLA73DRAFT_187183 [Serpula lacrymans var. lacrymans S7.3]EGO21423.1 hypothetical protein SERLADRAFT_476600 [Serpula lacrymans var. lacrymans S7.9]